MSEYSIDSEFKKLLNKKLSERALQMLSVYEEAAAKGETEEKETEEKEAAETEKIKSEKEENKADIKKKEAEIKKDADDVALDPEFQKEFFLDTFNYKGKVITLKKVGMGASAPVSAYVDGKRADIFLTQKQALAGIKKIIDLKGIKEQTNLDSIQPVSIKNIQEIGIRGSNLKHSDGNITFFSFNDASNILEMYENLNNRNKKLFQKELGGSQKAAVGMIHHFQEMLKRDLV